MHLFLSERFTTLELREYSRPRAQVPTVPDYLFYHADLIEERIHSTNFRYINNTAVAGLLNSPYSAVI